MTWDYYWAAGGHTEQPAYDQFLYGNCQVGCGPVAWAMLFCWGDYQAENGNSYWAARTGLYKANGGRGANAVAPLTQDSGVENVIEELNGWVDTFCAFGQGATHPSTMPGASGYLSGRTGTRLETHYNIAGIHETRLRDYARDSIKYRDTPAVIGIDWFQHYALAYGYAYQERIVRRCVAFVCWDEVVYDRCFYINQGWGGYGNEWITASTWFAGEIYP
jgi:hypothetical protein